MTRTRITVTLDGDIAVELNRVIGRRRRSVFVNETVRQRLQSIRVQRMLAKMEAEAGPIPEDVRRRVDALEWPQ